LDGDRSKDIYGITPQGPRIKSSLFFLEA
jgi:hypothetical protein